MASVPSEAPLFREWANQWLSLSPHLKPKTIAGYVSLLKNHLLPRFGELPIDEISPLEVRTWVADLQRQGLSSSRIRQAYGVLRTALVTAVECAVLDKSPCIGVKLPRIVYRETLFLDARQVDALAAAVAPRYRALIYVLAYCGLRWGEAAALRRAGVDLESARLRVRESITEVNGKLVFGDTKTSKPRDVVIAAFLVAKLRDHLATVPNDPDAIVFTSTEGRPMRVPNFHRRVWRPALAAAGLPKGLRVHDLRHTAAGLLIAQGLHPKVIQQHLGHATIAITMDRYGHLLPGLMDEVAAALQRVHEDAGELRSA